MKLSLQWLQGYQNVRVTGEVVSCFCIFQVKQENEWKCRNNQTNCSLASLGSLSKDDNKDVMMIENMQ